MPYMHINFIPKRVFMRKTWSHMETHGKRKRIRITITSTMAMSYRIAYSVSDVRTPWTYTDMSLALEKSENDFIFDILYYSNSFYYSVTVRWEVYAASSNKTWQYVWCVCVCVCNQNHHTNNHQNTQLKMISSYDNCFWTCTTARKHT